MLKTSFPCSSVAIPLLFLTACATTTVTTVSTSFGARWPALNDSGEYFPTTYLDLDTLEDGQVYVMSLGDERSLILRDIGEALHPDDPEKIHQIVQRSYDFVEEMTGLPATGDTMLFLLPLDRDNNSYSIDFDVAPEDSDRWAWIAPIVFHSGDRIHGPDYSLPLYEELLLGTPHEITEGLLGDIPNFQFDHIGEPSFHTRWFFDGASEYVGSQFAKIEFPYLWAESRFERSNIRGVMESDEVRQSTLDWVGNIGHVWSEDQKTGTPAFEFQHYAASLLLVEVWTEHIPLREIVALIREYPGPVDGEVLLQLVKQTTGFGRDEFVQAARARGQALSKPALEVYVPLPLSER